MKGNLTLLDIFLGVIIIVGLSFYYVMLRTDIVKLGYELSGVQKRKVQVLEENAKLKLELSALKAPIRIEPLAKGFGLCYPSQDRIVEIRK